MLSGSVMVVELAGATERSADARARVGSWALAEVGVDGGSCCPCCGGGCREDIGSGSLISFPLEGDSRSLTDFLKDARPLARGDKMLDTKLGVRCVVLGLRASSSTEVSIVRSIFSILIKVNVMQSKRNKQHCRWLPVKKLKDLLNMILRVGSVSI